MVDGWPSDVVITYQPSAIRCLHNCGNNVVAVAFVYSLNVKYHFVS